MPVPDADAAAETAPPLRADALAPRVSLGRAALRILGDTALYRIRKHEANNLIATLSLLIARGAPLGDLLVRTAFAALLNLLVYLLNDLGDVELDLTTPGKDRRKTEFLHQHRAAALVAMGAIFAVLVVVGLLHSPLLVAAAVASTAIVAVYTFWLKRRPFVDVGLMAVCGFTMTLCGVREADLARSLVLAGFLGLISANFQVLQVTRDVVADQAAGLRTTAAVLGARWAGLFFRGLTVLTAAYALLVTRSYAGLGLVVVLFLPVSAARAARTWDAARVLFGAVYLAMLLGW
ncbi:MAG TPA: UbiA family prenyltransferase [Polyangia bacterium]